MKTPEKEAARAEYTARINRVLDYIEDKCITDICIPVKPL